MAIAVATTRQALADRYTQLGNYVGLTTASPGAGPAVANEATGGSYVRKQFTWTPGTGGVANGSAVAVDCAAGTYTHGILCSAASGSNLIDWNDFADVVMTGPGQIVCTPQYNQT
jgi:hypothetical protein